MNLQIVDRRGQVLDGAKALIEITSFFDLGAQQLRHRRAGLIVQGKFSENFWRHQPAFVQLAGQFHKVTLGVGAGQRWERYVR